MLKVDSILSTIILIYLPQVVLPFLETSFTQSSIASSQNDGFGSRDKEEELQPSEVGSGIVKDVINDIVTLAVIKVDAVISKFDNEGYSSHPFSVVSRGLALLAVLSSDMSTAMTVISSPLWPFVKKTCSESSSELAIPAPVSYTHLTLPTKA